MNLQNNVIRVGFVFLLTIQAAFAASTEEQGLAIIQEVDHRNTGYGDTKAELKMILRNSNGEESTRSLKMDTLEISNDGDKSLTVFESPPDVNGTAFLSFTHALEPDDQWLYLPALKRVKRISSSNKSGPFLGSEFAFEDLTSFEVAKYKYNYLREEKLNQSDCYVVEMFPQYADSGYTRLISWIEKERYIPLKTDYYDRKNELLKTLAFNGYQQYLKQFWRADELIMINHQNGKSTRLLSENIRFRTGLTDRDFDQNTLKRSK
jgi:outer membrane lipoprotein-sorting protein